MLFYFSTLYIVRCYVVFYVENAILNDLGTWYFVTLYIWGEVCGLSFFKTDGDIAGSEGGGKGGGKVGGSQTERVVYCAEAGIGIRTIESLVEQDDTVVAVEHQIAGVDCAGLVCGGGKRGGQVMVFLIAVQFVHRDGIGLSGAVHLPQVFQNAHRHVADGVPQTINDEQAAHIAVSRLGRKEVSGLYLEDPDSLLCRLALQEIGFAHRVVVNLLIEIQTQGNKLLVGGNITFHQHVSVDRFFVGREFGQTLHELVVLQREQVPHLVTHDVPVIARVVGNPAVGRSVH